MYGIQMSLCVCVQSVFVKCFRPFKVFFLVAKLWVGRERWEDKHRPALREDEDMAVRWDGWCVWMRPWWREREKREEGDVYGWGWGLGGESEASKLLVKWKWLFSRIQDTWALRWINVSDLLSESLSEGKRGREREAGGGGEEGRRVGRPDVERS